MKKKKFYKFVKKEIWNKFKIFGKSQKIKNSGSNDDHDQPNYFHNEVCLLAKKIGFPTEFEL